MKYLSKQAFFATFIIPKQYIVLKNILEQILNRHDLKLSEFLSSHGKNFITYLYEQFDEYIKTQDDNVLKHLIEFIEQDINKNLI